MKKRIFNGGASPDKHCMNQKHKYVDLKKKNM